MSTLNHFNNNILIETQTKKENKNLKMENNNNGGSHNGTRIWIKRTLVDSIRNPKVQRYGRNAAVGGSSSSNATTAASTPSLQRPHQFGGIAAAMSISSSSSMSRKPSSDDGSEGGSSIVTSSVMSSNGGGGNNANGTSLGRHQAWGWLPGVLCEQSSTKLVVKVDDNVVSTSTTPTSTLSVPPSSLEQGDILLDNELPLNNQGQALPPQDLIKLTHLHEPAVVQSLKLRYEQNIIYTATGPVLLALNPFQNIRGLYGEATMKTYYSTSDKSSLPPHVYQIADASFRSMMRRIDETVDDPDQAGKCNQSILVSGESGAGKTVTTKFVMKYLAALSQRSMKSPTKRAYQRAKEHQTGLQNLPETPSSSTPKGAAGASPSWAYTTPNVKPPMLDRKETGLSSATTLSGSSTSSIEAKVLQSNPILESFGNARTVRNDNSSRFGKFIEIQFTSSGKLVGATIDTYLLEKVRLVTQSPGERNYHIFYEILDGMPANELRHYFLAKTAAPEDFAMLSSSGISDRRDGILDKDTYQSLRLAMNTMKLSNDEITDIFSVACAILHASNLDFIKATTTDDEECSLDPDNVHLAPVCHLLGINGEDLNEALCTLHIQAGGGDTVRKSLSKEKAEKGLQALLKTTYGALFQYLVKRINDSIAWKKAHTEDDDDSDEAPCRDAPAATIGVLDIFGFESFQTNSFEQLCINYCNEALQQQFNAFVLKNEQEEYEREGIEWSFIEFPENQDVLDLIDKRGQGILNILDDQCRAPGTNDGSFALDVYRKSASSQRFRANRKQQSRHQFEICHYAGPVEYTAEGFVEKNRDELPKESLELLATSERDFVRILADILSGTDASSSSNNNNPNSSFSAGGPIRLNRADSSLASSGKTVGGQFRRQLKELRQKIDQTSPHYVRCLKPNDDLVPDHFDTAIVAEQLRCGGILEAVRVSRAGFTQHYPHEDFVKRYRMLALGSELSAAATGRKSFGGGVSPTTLLGGGGGRLSFGSSNKTNTVTPKSTYSGKRWGVPSQSGGGRPGSYSPETSSGAKNNNTTNKNNNDGVSPKDQCKDLLKVLSKKIREFEKEEMKENVPEDGGAAGGDASTPSPIESSKPAAAKAKSYSFKQTSSTPPAWANRLSKNTNGGAVGGTANFASPLPPTTPGTSNKPSKIKTSYQAWNNTNAKSSTPVASGTPETGTPQSPSYRAASYRRGFSGSDAAKLGIQVGKTKVFLRHRAFEVLERIRSRQQTSSATKLNSIFRMHLCRTAYLPIRDAFRREMRIHTGDDSFAKETKEEDNNMMVVERSSTPKNHIPVSKRWQHSGGYATALVESYESQVRASIHNPVPRNEWGKTQKDTMTSFKWMLVEGLWVKNPVFREDREEAKEGISA